MASDAPASAPESTRALAAALLAGAGAVAGPRLTVVAGGAPGTRVPLRDGAVLGRGRGAALRIDDPLASRRHARFAVQAGRAAVHDLGSKNGVVVNGRRARGPVPLRPGDAVRLGATVLRYDDDRPAPQAAARAGRRRAAACAALALVAALLALAAWAG